jgi:arylsulfate sulfotransferase
MTNNRPHSHFKYRKALILAGVLVLAFILVVMGFLYLNPAYALSTETAAYVQAVVDGQRKIDEELQAYYKAGNYTFTEPMLIQDPYQTAPLTALLVFDTPEPSQISIHIPGKTPPSTVDFTFPGFQKHHEIPIYGLYAGSVNHINISLKTQTGETAQNGIDLRTEPLPVSIRKFQVDTVDPARYNPGFNFAIQDQKPVFDIDGNVRWYTTQKSYESLTKLKNGRFLFTYSVAGGEGNILMEQDLLGKIHAIYHVQDGSHHDVYELPTGNLLIPSSDLKSGTIEDQIIELGRTSGHIVRSFDLKTILDEGRPRQVTDLAANDWLHLNSIIYDPTDQSIIISSKSQSAVVKLTYPGMHIKWILGPHDNWSPKYQPYLLKPKGTPFEWSWSQHHATLFSPDQAGDKNVDILLFDNGLYRSFDPARVAPMQEWYSRVVHYRINATSMTIEQVWEYGQELGTATFSALRGSAYRLPNGDVLGTWGDIYKDAQGNPAVNLKKNATVETKIIEVDPSDNLIVFECSIAGVETYRTLRAGFYDGYSEENDYLSTTLHNTAGMDLADRSFLASQDLKRWTITPLLAWLKDMKHSLQGAGK